MTQFSELTVIIKDDEKTFRKKFPIYESYQVSDEDHLIKNCIHEALENFDGKPDKITVKIHLDVE